MARMLARLRTFGIEAIGWGLLLLAVLVSPLPVLPSLLLLAALFFLSSRYSWASRLLEKGKKLLPARSTAARAQSASTPDAGS